MKKIYNGNLKFINFKPYYESALKGDLTIFEKLKSELEYTLYKRVSEEKKDKILIFADAACSLSATRNLRMYRFRKMVARCSFKLDKK